MSYRHKFIEAIRGVDDRPYQSAEYLADRVISGQTELHASWGPTVRSAADWAILEHASGRVADHDHDPSIGRREGLDRYNGPLRMHDLYGACPSDGGGVLRYMADCMVPSERGMVISIALIDAKYQEAS